MPTGESASQRDDPGLTGVRRVLASFVQLGEAYRRGGPTAPELAERFDELEPHLRRQLDWLDQRAPDPASLALRLNATIGTADLMLRRLPIEEQLTLIEPALEYARRLGDARGEHAMLIRLGNVYYTWGRARPDLFEQALVIAEREREPVGQFLALNGLAGFAYARSDVTAARELYRRALTIAEQAADDQLRARALVSLAGLCLRDGDEIEAERLLADAETIAADHGLPPSIEGDLHRNLGLVKMSQARPVEAAEHFGRQYALGKRVGDARLQTSALVNQGVAYQRAQRWNEAETAYTSAADLAYRQGNLRQYANALGNLGELTTELGDLDRAWSFHQQSLQYFELSGEVRGHGRELLNGARIQHRRGELADARQRAQRALEVLTAINDPYAAQARDLLDELSNGTESAPR